MAEHLDHLYYIKDILSLGVVSLNSVLTDQLLNRLLIPLYVFSLTDHSPFPEGVSMCMCVHVWPMSLCLCSILPARESSHQQHSGPVPSSSGIYRAIYLSPHLSVLMYHMQVFLILSEPDVVLPLAYVILTGDTSLSLPPLLTQTHPAAVRMSTAVSLDLSVPLVLV